MSNTSDDPLWGDNVCGPSATFVVMPFPRVIARLNKRYTNRFIEPLVSKFPGYVQIVHTGRRSGRTYRTPMYAFPADDKLAIALTYGPGADWAQNVLAGDATVERHGRSHVIESATLVDREVAWPHLPLVVRCTLRLLQVNDFLLLSAPGDENH